MLAVRSMPIAVMLEVVLAVRPMLIVVVVLAVHPMLIVGLDWTKRNWLIKLPIPHLAAKE